MRYHDDIVRASRIVAWSSVVAAVLAGAVPSVTSRGQAPGALVYSVLSREGRRALEARRLDGQDLVALDEVAAIFGLTLREDADVGGLTLTRQGRTIVLSRGQALASVAGRVIALPTPPVQEGRRVFAPVELLSRAVATVAGVRIEVRKPSRLVIVGDLRVPRVDLRYEGAGPRARLLIDVDPAAPHRVVQEDRRLAVVIDADALDAHLAPPESAALASAIRVVEPSTIVVELGPAFASFRASDLASPSGTSRFAIDLVGTSAEARPVPSEPSPPPPTAPTAPPAPPFERPAPGELRTVAVDPGHGGADAGVRGPGGTLEKDVTLSVAQRLKAALEARLGVRVLLTRSGDEAVSLDERAARANTNKADVFLSLHANASLAAPATGVEVLSLGLDDYAPGALGGAPIEGPVLPVFGGTTRRLDFVDWETAQIQHLASSGALAAAIEDEVGRVAPVRPHAVRQAPLRVLVGANMPAVLVELGFLTNPDEERRLTADAHQAALAQAIVDALVRFRDQRGQTGAGPTPGGGAPTPRP